MSGVAHFLCLCWLLLLPLAANADLLRIDGDETRVPLAGWFEYLGDPEMASSIDDVAGRTTFRRFADVGKQVDRRSPYWLRLQVENASPAAMVRWIVVDPGHFRQASLFFREGDGWRRVDADGLSPLREHPTAGTAAIFPIRLAASEFATFYMRIEPGVFRLQATLWEPRAFLGADGRNRLLHGAIIGGLLSTALLGLLFLVLLRDRAFAFNALATFAYCLGEASAKGYGGIYLWPEAGLWAADNLPMFALAGVVLNILFLRELLSTARRFPRIDRLLLVLMAIQGLPALGILFGDFHFWSALLFRINFPATVVLALVGVYAMSRGVHAARYYTAAYVVLATGSLMHALSKANGAFTVDILPFAMLFSNLLLLASVVDRVMVARKDRETTQAALLAVQTEHAEQLERSVARRTADLHEALQEKQRADQIKSRLIAFVGHDLRAPLATIVNYVDLLGTPEDKDSRRYCAAIRKSAHYQLELIDDLVEYAQVEMRCLTLNPVSCFVYDWLDNVASQGELLSRQNGNRFSLDIETPLPPVLVFDPKRLRQILLNLLGNAAKFTRMGEIRLLIRVASCNTAEAELVFAVVDNGPGISPEVIEKVMQPFVRGDSGHAGFGLGLTIVGQLLDAIGSDLEIDSHPGGGSRFGFAVRLPVGDEAEVPQIASVRQPPKRFGSGKRVLLVDDHAVNNDYLREILMLADFDVIAQTDSGHALGLALEARFDIVVLDQFMPGLDGWEFLNALHAAGAAAVPLCILHSAMPPARPADFPEKIDFDIVLLKPVSADGLLERLEKYLFPVAGQARPPPDILAPLRDMVADGRISDVEDWAQMLKARFPEWSAFADRVHEAAVVIDLAGLAGLSGE